MKALPLFLIVLAASLVATRAPAANLDDAHRAFAEGKYQDSTQGYNSVLAERGYSAPVLFDLGNSLYRQGDLGQAILAYKRGLWLDPSDADIAANLQLAQKQAGVAITEPRPTDKFTRILSASGWACLGCAAWTVFCVSLLARRIVAQFQALFFTTGFGSAIVLAVAIAAMVISSRDLSEAVVTDKKAAALISPFPAAQTVFSPAVGESVTVQKAYNDFLLVTDHAGHSGWISKAQVSQVIPGTSAG